MFVDYFKYSLSFFFFFSLIEKITEIKVIKHDKQRNYTVCKCDLETGRKHQIRVHLASINHPLLSDPLYGYKSKFIKRTALHAYKLEFLHPITNSPIIVKAPLPQDMEFISNQIDFINNHKDINNLYDLADCNEIDAFFVPLLRQVKLLKQKYDVVITNPPYMPTSNGKDELNKYVKQNYPDSKTDLFAVFIERCKAMLKANGYQAMITMHSWMFVSSYEKLREKILLNDIVNMAHLGARAFEDRKSVV